MGWWQWMRERLGGEASDTTPVVAVVTEGDGPVARGPMPAREPKKMSRKERGLGRIPKAPKGRRKKSKKRKQHRSPHAPPVKERPKRSAPQVASRPRVSPIFAPPRLDGDDEAVRVEAVMEPVVAEVEPAATGAEPSEAELVEARPAEPRPVEQSEEAASPVRPTGGRRDVLSWVVLPRFEALLDGAVEALAALAGDRAALIGARKRLERDWRGLGTVPRDHRDRLAARLSERRVAFDVAIEALPDPRKIEQEAQIAAKTVLVEEAEALASRDDLRVALEAAKDLRDRWRSAPRVPREAHAELSGRWRVAMDAVFARREAQRGERLDGQRALLARAEALTGAADAVRAADAMKGLQRQWKGVGSAGRSEEAEAVWQAFRAAADTVFERSRTARQAIEAKNLAAKEVLVTEAIALAASGEVVDPEDEIRRLHRQWRRIGHVPREHSDAVWSAFRDAMERIRTPPKVDPAALGDGDGALSFSPFTALSEESDGTKGTPDIP